MKIHMNALKLISGLATSMLTVRAHKASNLRQHIKAVHQKLQPFACRYSGCRKKFPYRGDFIETDEHLRSRPRGGRKRKCVSVETLKGEEERFDLMDQHAFFFVQLRRDTLDG
ncbi:hypothetical protein OPV22_015225 [Ensete ventricosum]|uniref:C2H2-type domain-containing protein n=1 Tax=Ensete ventricosum TaxID=4639 RepID=A0AAV8PS73_ENSVE|nr:hypothetical protein OPV22_015225 [Ensete ventricosum]